MPIDDRSRTLHGMASRMRERRAIRIRGDRSGRRISAGDVSARRVRSASPASSATIAKACGSRSRARPLDARSLHRRPGARRAARIAHRQRRDRDHRAVRRARASASRRAPRASDGARASAAIPADLAPCEDCLRELCDPADRRYRYPFINCTACGPRFTIVRDVPYDRAEDDDGRVRDVRGVPARVRGPCATAASTPSRTRVPACGPQVRARRRGTARSRTRRRQRRGGAPRSRAGEIVAVKGAGGFVLAVDATIRAAVARLRERKRRPHKPFAVMGRSLAALERIVDARRASRARSRRRSRATDRARARARDELLAAVGRAGPSRRRRVPAADAAAVPARSPSGPPLQVMTSGNLAEEPIARTNDEAFARLAAVADLFLVHDREIHARADDSVVRAPRGRAIPMRRARGFVPDAIALPVAAPPRPRRRRPRAQHGLPRARGAGGALAAPRRPRSSRRRSRSSREAIAHLERADRRQRRRSVAHDLHPDYRSTRWALASRPARRSRDPAPSRARRRVPRRARPRPIASIGVAFDGTGLGDDGDAVGRRDPGRRPRAPRAALGHLRPLALPGGEAAIREPWRLAAAALARRRRSLDLLVRDPRSVERAPRACAARDRLPARAIGRRPLVRRRGGAARGGARRSATTARRRSSSRRSRRPATADAVRGRDRTTASAVRDRSAPDGARARTRAPPRHAAADRSPRASTRRSRSRSREACRRTRRPRRPSS